MSARKKVLGVALTVAATLGMVIATAPQAQAITYPEYRICTWVKPAHRPFWVFPWRWSYTKTHPTMVTRDRLDRPDNCANVVDKSAYRSTWGYRLGKVEYR